MIEADDGAGRNPQNACELETGGPAVSQQAVIRDVNGEELEAGEEDGGAAAEAQAAEGASLTSAEVVEAPPAPASGKSHCPRHQVAALRLLLDNGSRGVPGPGRMPLGVSAWKSEGHDKQAY